jgi:Flp pilus assembly pilin Flp
MRGQHAIESAVLIAVVGAALVAMAFYVKRALNSKWRQVGDTFGQGRQYEPGVTAVTKF